VAAPASPAVARRVAALVFYAAVVAWLTWPLATRLGEALPGTRAGTRFDGLYAGWVLAHETRALGTAPSTLLDAAIYHPARRTLFYSLTAFGALPLFAPAFAATGNPTLALNVLFLGGVALTAWALHVVVAAWTGLELAGLVAAATFLANRWVLWEWIPTAPQYAALCWFPFVVALAAARAPTARTLATLGVLVVLQSLTDLTYVAPAVFAPLAVLAAVRLARRDTRSSGLALAAVLVLALVALAPVYAGHVAVARGEPDLAAQTHFPARPLDETAGPASIFGSLAATDVPTPALVLVVAGLLLRLRRWRDGAESAWTAAAAFAGVGIVIALPPLVEWRGHVITLPHYAIGRVIPLYRYFRPPARLGTGALAGLALLAGLAFAEVGRRSGALARVALAAVVVGALYAAYARGGDPVFPREALPASYPLFEPPGADSALVAALERETGPVLELPVGPPYGMLVHAAAMYRAIYHRRPLLNGYGSYWPSGFAERMALAERLPDPDALAALVAETGVTTIVVHLGGLPPERRRAWPTPGGAADPGLEPVALVDSDLVERVRPH
jgi:hypothetical protein